MLLDMVLQEIKSKKTLVDIILKSCNEWEIPNLSISRGIVYPRIPLVKCYLQVCSSNRFRFQTVLLIVIVSLCSLFPVMLFIM